MSHFCKHAAWALQWSNMLIVMSVLLIVDNASADDSARPQQARTAESKQAASGYELFTREWIPGDKRTHGGDGLGPMFNETSCVACHNQGGTGGGGPASKNVDIVTAFNNRRMMQQQAPQRIRPKSLPEQIFLDLFGELDPPAAQAEAQSVPKLSAEELAKLRQEKQAADRKKLAKLHPGFQFALSIVLHRSATYPAYQAWRSRLSGMSFGDPEEGAAADFFDAVVADALEDAVPQTRVGSSNPLMQKLKNEVRMAAQRGLNNSRQHGNFAIVRSQRNTTALFGAGLIDAIPVEVLKLLEREQLRKTRISGRVAMLKDGKIGRFGWKAQMASLSDFVLTACAVEVGLNVPDHPQAGVPHKPDYRPPGLDLNAAECTSLINYIRDLPAPVQRDLSDPTDAKYVLDGQTVFATVGCADCHVADVGTVKGIYSDLLLHDLGHDLGDTGSYGVFVPNSTPGGDETPLPELAGHSGGASSQRPRNVIGATRLEWRTPPLWGIRDSAPYLHDGRAKTLEQAIAMHGGEASQSTQRYFALSPAERFKVETFLKSLVAPVQVASK